MMDGALTKLQMDQQIALGIILMVCGLVRIILDWLAGLIRRWPFFSAVFFCCSAVDRCGCCCGATSSRRLSLSLGFCCLLLPGGWHFLSAGELEKATLAGLPSVPLLKIHSGRPLYYLFDLRRSSPLHLIENSRVLDPSRFAG